MSCCRPSPEPLEPRATPAAFALHPLARTASARGTPGPDVLRVAAADHGERLRLTLDGRGATFPASAVDAVVFRGAGGHDRVRDPAGVPVVIIEPPGRAPRPVPQPPAPPPWLSAPVAAGPVEGFAWPAGAAVTVGYETLSPAAQQTLAQVVAEFDALPVGLKLADVGPAAAEIEVTDAALGSVDGSTVLAETQPFATNGVLTQAFVLLDEVYAASGPYDVPTLLRHELGHAVGLAHNPNPVPYNDGTDVMHPYLAPGEVRLYGADDVLALQGLYGGG